MNTKQTVAACHVTHEQDQQLSERREYLLAALRTAVASLRLAQLDVEEIGLALRFKMIGPDAALEWAHGLGLLQHIPNKGTK